MHLSERGDRVANIKPIRSRVQLELLDPQQLKEIKSATLHILEHVGVQFPSERALQVFAEHGAQVDRESQIVRLAPGLVIEAMGHAPRTYRLFGRAEGTELLLDGRMPATSQQMAAGYIPSTLIQENSAHRAKTT
jgi:trimethylamine:corrinoid methyltransferase-like protein